jgi:histidyl-tRNA synthetase
MEFIQIKINLLKKEATIYSFDQNTKIVTIPSLKKEILRAYLKVNRWNIKGVMIDRYKPFLEELNDLYPEAILCISPESMREILKAQKVSSVFLQKVQQLVLEEMAITIEENVKEDFFTQFYSYETKEEASAFYTLWQIHSPLNLSYLYAIVRNIEYYKEPVFNYFLFKKALAASK